MFSCYTPLPFTNIDNTHQSLQQYLYASNLGWGRDYHILNKMKKNWKDKTVQSLETCLVDKRYNSLHFICNKAHPIPEFSSILMNVDKGFHGNCTQQLSDTAYPLILPNTTHPLPMHPLPVHPLLLLPLLESAVPWETATAQ